MTAGYQIVIGAKTGTIAPGEFLVVEAECPNDMVLVGGGGWTQPLPNGTASNYVLKSSWPLWDGAKQAYKWVAIFTNTAQDVHPQVVEFEARAICVPKITALGA